MSNNRDYNFSRGDKLLVELTTNEIYRGTYISGNKDRIDLINCFLDDELAKPQSSQGKLNFYRADIASIIVIDKPLRVEYSVKEEEENVVQNKIVKITECEYQRLKDMARSYIYMPTMDQRFHAAIEHLTNCENIGVVRISTKAGRAGKTDLLVLCSWDVVYLFDISIYNKKKLDKGLVEILENPNIKKIVHDSRDLVDCMFHCYEVVVTNIFDTFVADFIISGEGHRSLSECLAKYLNFPENLINQNNNSIKWNERPIEETNKVTAAQLGCYLITLKNYLETEMLKGFYKKVKDHSSSTILETPLNAHIALSKLQIF